MDALEEMRNVMNEITGQILSGDFSLSSDSYQESSRSATKLGCTPNFEISNDAWLCLRSCRRIFFTPDNLMPRFISFSRYDFVT